jgi:hypothetical protein
MSTPKEFARKVSSKAIAEGFKPEALHTYADREGNPLYWRVRAKHPDGRKFIRPFHADGDGFVMGEPEFLAGKPLYRLRAINPDGPIMFVEGEKDADALAKIGINVTTSGGATSAKDADLSLIAGCSCRIWPDNDEPGAKYAAEMAARLLEIGCTVEIVDVAALDLPDKGDAVDWLSAHPGATAADVWALRAGRYISAETPTHGSDVPNVPNVPTADIAALIATCERAIQASKDDPTAYLSREYLDAFMLVRVADRVEYKRLRTRLKLANHAVSVTSLDEETAGRDGERERESPATALASLAVERCELWHDPDARGFASLDRDGHREHWAIDSSGFREWLAWLGHTEGGAAPSSETIKTAQNTLAGVAKFDGDEHRVFRRVGKDESGQWVDVGDPAWRAILITATGWRIVDKPPIRFLRDSHARALPIPEHGGDLSKLWPLVNVPTEDRPLATAWLIEALRDGTPYPVLEIGGEQGSAKSTTQRVLRALTDPNRVMLRAAPKAREDLFVAAATSHVVSLENLSHLSIDNSDALCTIAMGGGGHATRQLFTNGEEHLMEAHNPVMMNGIAALVTRQDLLDRAVVLSLPVITERRTEGEHTAQLERDAPSIMGGLLDLFADALATLPDVRISPRELPRMADFATLGEAIHRAQGNKPGEWLAMYHAHRAEAVQRTIEGDPVGLACKQFVEAGNSYTGTVGSLLPRLNDFVGEARTEKGDYWPRTPRGLSNGLRRLAPALRLIGIECLVETKKRRGTEGQGFYCVLRLAPPASGNVGNIGNVKTISSPASGYIPPDDDNPATQRGVI